MLMRHLVFADCAELTDPQQDPVLHDTFTGMAYGVYPFGVQENREGTHLLFRHLVDPEQQRDKQRRMAEAVESLMALPSVRLYHAELGDSNHQLHLEPDNTVAWPLTATRQQHLAVVPDLLQWVGWDGDRGWEALRRQVTKSAMTGNHPTYTSLPRHLKLAHVLDHVGERAVAAGCDPVATCARAMNQFALARLEVTTGEGGVGVVDVQGY